MKKLLLGNSGRGFSQPRVQPRRFDGTNPTGPFARTTEEDVPMIDADLATIASQAAHEVLLWVGFGTLAGLAAKAIMPGRDPGDTLATILMGIAGSVIGCGIMAFFDPNREITPISPLGFVLATAGAFMLLLFHRILGGKELSTGIRRRQSGTWKQLFRRNRGVIVQEID